MAKFIYLNNNNESTVHKVWKLTKKWENQSKKIKYSEIENQHQKKRNENEDRNCKVQRKVKVQVNNPIR